jgi:hypothetical protein
MNIVYCTHCEGKGIVYEQGSSCASFPIDWDQWRKDISRMMETRKDCPVCGGSGLMRLVPIPKGEEADKAREELEKQPVFIYSYNSASAM